MSRRDGAYAGPSPALPNPAARSDKINHSSKRNKRPSRTRDQSRVAWEHEGHMQHANAERRGLAAQTTPATTPRVRGT